MTETVAIVPFVEGKFTQAEGFATSAYQTTMEAVLALVQIAEQLTLINRTISIDTTTVSASTPTRTPPSIDTSEFKVAMPSLPADPVIVDASIGSLPEFPTVPTNTVLTLPNENYYAYSRALLDAIKSKLLSDVLSGSTGLTPAIEQAIFDRERERSLIELRDAKDREAAEWSSMGWPLPNGLLVGAKSWVGVSYQNKRLDMSRDVSIKSFELALTNYHFIIEKGLNFEAGLLQWAHSVAQLAFDAAKTLVQTDIEEFKSLIQVASEKTKAIIDAAMAKIAYNKGLIDYAIGKLDSYSAYIRGQSDRVNAVARGYEAETNLYKAITDVDISRAGLDIKVIEAKIQQALGNAGIMIKDKELEQKNYELLNTLKGEIMKAIGAIAAQLVAGALSSAHAQASITASITDDVNAIAVANINAAAEE